MSNKLTRRIKSAASIHRRYWSQNELPPLMEDHIISNLPVSESRYVSKEREKHPATANTIAFSKIAISKTNPSSTSQIWRKVHSTRSEMRLRSLNGSRIEQEPIRLNLMQKVERIKSKHIQREQQFNKYCSQTERIIHQRCTSLKKQGEKGDLSRKISDLLAPFQYASKLAEQRYRARLLKVKKY